MTWQELGRVCPLEVFTPHQQTAVALIQAGVVDRPEQAFRMLDHARRQRPAKRRAEVRDGQ